MQMRYTRYIIKVYWDFAIKCIMRMHKIDSNFLDLPIGLLTGIKEFNRNYSKLLFGDNTSGWHFGLY